MKGTTINSKQRMAAMLAMAIAAACAYQCHHCPFGFCDDEDRKCGSSNIDKKSKGCCDEVIYNLKTEGCCAGKTYGTESQRCESDAIQSRCGSNWYAPSNSEFCVDGRLSPEKGSFTDARDGKTYKYVTIGNSNWMAQNLNYAHEESRCGGSDSIPNYRNGIIQSYHLSIEEGDNENCEKYGRLYEWHAAMESCPAGWHLSGEEEWDALSAVGRASFGKALRADSGWRYSGNGTDDYGFSAVPGGAVTPERGGWSGGDGDSYWGANKFKANSFWSRSSGGGGASGTGYTNWSRFVYQHMFSVRCVQGALPASREPSPPAAASSFGSFTDARDGKTYKTVKIGAQTWMAENLNYGEHCYDNKPENCEKYGSLYGHDMYICPAGWHLPTSNEWDKLLQYAEGISGMESGYDSERAGKYLKAKEGWKDLEFISANGMARTVPGNGEDRYGFAALPGGWSDNIANTFGGIGRVGYWLINTGDGSFTSTRLMDGLNDGVTLIPGSGIGTSQSIRCVKD